MATPKVTQRPQDSPSCVYLSFANFTKHLHLSKVQIPHRTLVLADAFTHNTAYTCDLPPHLVPEQSMRHVFTNNLRSVPAQFFHVQVCGAFRRKVLPSSSGSQQSNLVIAYIVGGVSLTALTNT